MDKYHFAVCDDEEVVRSLIAGWLLKSPYKGVIKEYDSGEKLLKDIDAGAKLDILFLDIAMGEADGIDTARELGKRVEKSGRSMRASRPLIIFVTGIPDRMGDAFGVRAYGYLLKPITREMFEAELQRAVDELSRLDAQMVCETIYEEKEAESITLQSGRITVNAALKDILYIESSGRKTMVHLKDNTYDVYKKMEEFEKILGRSFFRIHRGYLVNMQHVKGYSRTEVYMDNGDFLLISKYKYPDFTKAYMDFIS
jgi:DNA-binding LytR/AlgR family response regulator